MLPARDAPVVPGRTLRFDRTPGARRSPVPVHGQTVLDTCVAPDRSLTGRALVFVIGGDIAEVAFVELPLGFVIGGLGFGHQRGDAGSLALENLFTLEVASIGERRQLLDTHRLLSLLAHRRQL